MRAAAPGRRMALALAALLLAAGLGLVPLAAPAAATTLPAGFVEQVLASGLDLPPTVATLPDGRLLVAEKAGVIRVVKNGTLLSTPFADLRSRVNDYTDRGLTGIVADPDFAANGRVYLLYPFDRDGTDSG